MKNLLMTFMLFLGVAAMQGSAAHGATAWFDDAGDLGSWNVSEKNPGEYVTVEGTSALADTNGLEFWLSSWNDARSDDGSWTDIWKGSGVTIEAEKEYALTVKIASWDDGTEGDEVGSQPAGAGDQIYIAMEDWTGATITLAESYVWPDNTTPGNDQGYVNYSTSFNTYGGNNAASVGAEIGVSISGIEWWNNFSISEMSIDAIPEPATMSLLAFGTLTMLGRRRKL